MSEKEQYMTFSKNNTTVILPNGEKIIMPKYIENALKTYRFNFADLTLEKKCHVCKNWFKVLQVVDNELKDIHSENEYHLVKSGFGSYCQGCKLKLNNTKPNLNKHTVCKSNPIVEISTSELLKQTVFLSAENIKYIQLRAAAEGVKKNAFINRIFDNLRLNEPINKFI